MLPVRRLLVSRGNVLSYRKAFSPPSNKPFISIPLRLSQYPSRRPNSSIAQSAQSTSSTTTPTPPPTPRSRYFRFTRTFLLSFTLLTIGFTMTAAPALPTAQEIASPPTDAETLELYTPDDGALSEINDHLLSHPLSLSLFSNPKYIASRPHLKIPPSLRPHNLTGGTLLGEDKIAVPPLSFSTRDGTSFVSIQYLGSALCGHPGMIHGGLLATLLDEGLARCCFPALPNKVAVTASLKIDYRSPCQAGSYVVLRAETYKVEGRKAWVRGWLETLPGVGEWDGRTGKGDGEADGVVVVNGEGGGKPVVIAEAEALFIEPRGAATMARVYSTS